jgi:hypothetical protein
MQKDIVSGDRVLNKRNIRLQLEDVREYAEADIKSARLVVLNRLQDSLVVATLMPNFVCVSGRTVNFRLTRAFAR